MRLAGSLVAARRLLSCGMRTLSCGMHMGSSSLTRDRTRAPALGMCGLIHCATREVPGRRILNHWTAREVPTSLEFDTFFRLEQQKKPLISIRICQFVIHVTEARVEAPGVWNKVP